MSLDIRLESLRGLIFYPLDRYFSSFVGIFSPFPTFGGSLLSLLQPLSGPSCPFVDNSFPLRALRGSPLWISLWAFVDNPLNGFQTSGQWIVVGWGSVNGIHGGEEDSRRELGVLVFFSGGVDLLRRPGPLKYGTQTNSGSISFTFRKVVPETGSRYSKARPEGVLVIFLDQSMPRAEYMVAPMSSM